MMKKQKTYYAICWVIEYKVNQEQIRIIRNLLRHGMRAEVVAKSAEVPLSRVKAIERKMKK